MYIISGYFMYINSGYQCLYIVLAWLLGHLHVGFKKTDFTLFCGLHTPYANMADHSVVAWNELYESEASWATVFCFDSASTEKPCFVGDLVCFIPLCLRGFCVPECHQ